MTEREIVDWLFDHPAPGDVCRELNRRLVARIQSWTEEEESILSALDRGLSSIERRRLLEQLWDRITYGGLSDAAEARNRLLVGLIRESDDPLDWHLAEYFFFWCGQLNVPKDEVLSEFRACLQL